MESSKSALASVRRASEAMIEQNTAAKSRHRVDEDPSLDEARLRQQAIGVKLRQMFDEVVSEPVPDEFLEILRRADARDQEHGA